MALAYRLDFCCVCPEYFPLLSTVYGAAETPTFKGHHFSSLAAHKELELFLRENLSNNFRMLNSRKCRQQLSGSANDACLDSEPRKSFVPRLDLHILDPCVKVTLISRV
jgi:hypothetical protein